MIRSKKGCPGSGEEWQPMFCPAMIGCAHQELDLRQGSCSRDLRSALLIAIAAPALPGQHHVDLAAAAVGADEPV